MKILIDYDYTVNVQVVSQNVKTIFRKPKLQINGNGIADDLYTHLLIMQYRPWYDEQTEKIFLDKMNELINSWSIKKEYGKLCISKLKRVNICEDYYSYSFKVSVGTSYDIYKVIVDISSKYRSTWMQSNMLECDKSIKNLIESILFSSKNNEKIDVWLNDIKKSMEYIPGCVHKVYKNSCFKKGKVYIGLNEKTTEIYLIDYSEESNNGYVYYLNNNTCENVETFLKQNILEDFIIYTFIDDYFGNMFINIYKNRKN